MSADALRPETKARLGAWLTAKSGRGWQLNQRLHSDRWDVRLLEHVDVEYEERRTVVSESAKDADGAVNAALDTTASG